MYNMKIFAKENLKFVRMKAGYTAVDLAKKMNVSKSTIGQIERRVNGASPAICKEITDILGVEFDEIFEIVPYGTEG